MPRFDRETFYFPSIRLHFSSIPPIFFSLFLYFTFIRARVETREKMKNESTKTKKEKEREKYTKKGGEKIPSIVRGGERNFPEKLVGARRLFSSSPFQRNFPRTEKS